MGFYETIFFPSLSIHSFKQTLDSPLFLHIGFSVLLFLFPHKN